MHHEAHIGFVDAHAKGVRRHQNRQLPVDPAVLQRVSSTRIHAGVIGSRAQTDFTQRAIREFGDFIALLARRDINQAAAAHFRQAGQRFDEFFLTFRVAFATMNREMQVWPVEAANQFERLLHSQIGDDAFLNAQSCGRGHGQYRRPSQTFDDGFHRHVIGTKIVAPFRNTMRFIDHETRDSRTR